MELYSMHLSAMCSFCRHLNFLLYIDLVTQLFFIGIHVPYRLSLGNHWVVCLRGLLRGSIWVLFFQVAGVWQVRGWGFLITIYIVTGGINSGSNPYIEMQLSFHPLYPEPSLRGVSTLSLGGTGFFHITSCGCRPLENPILCGISDLGLSTSKAWHIALK